MKIENYQFPKSSFLSLEKDSSLIVEELIKNERLKKLIYYDTSDALQRPDLTQEQTLQLIKQNIKTVPKIKIDNSVLTYIIITFDNFTPTSNPEFRDNDIFIDIVCHLDQWQLKDYSLRPFKIAGELDYMLNEKKLTGIGTLQFLSANQTILTEDYAVLTLLYHATHGEDDKKGMLNPAEEAEFIKDFNKLYNLDEE